MTPAPLANQHIVVLFGGPSAEREVSLATGAAYADALERLGARVSRVDPGPDIGQIGRASCRERVCHNV